MNIDCKDTDLHAGFLAMIVADRLEKDSSQCSFLTDRERFCTDCHKDLQGIQQQKILSKYRKQGRHIYATKGFPAVVQWVLSGAQTSFLEEALRFLAASTDNPEKALRAIKERLAGDAAGLHSQVLADVMQLLPAVGGEQ